MAKAEAAELIRLIELIEVERARAGRPVFISVDGRSGAGKSHLVERLARELGDLTVVHMDDFYRELPDERRRQFSAREGADQFFDWQRLRNEALGPLRAGRTAVFHPFDWEKGCLSQGTIELSPASLVLIEGVYSARTELEDYLDLTVLVRVDETVRRRRLTARHDDPPSLVERWEAAEDYYFGQVRPDGEFAFVVDGLTV
jgi:uridine kinase